MFERFINEDFFVKLNTYLICAENKQSILSIIRTFLDNQLETLKVLRYSQLNISSTVPVEEVLANDTLFHIIKYTEEILNSIEEGKVFIYDEDDIDEQLINIETIYAEISKISNFIRKLKTQIKKYFNRPRKLNNLLKEILEIIDIFNNISSINDIAEEYELLIEKIKNDKTNSIYSVIKLFKSVVQNSYLKIVESNITTDKKNNDIFEKNNILQFGSSSVPDVISDYIINQYEVLPSGYKFIDDTITGFESENVYLICAPSNHGKSLLLVDIERHLLKTNIDEFNENDVILHVTLEDNRIKLSRRIFTIFGNYHPRLIKKLFYTIKKKSAYLAKIKHPNYSKVMDLTKAIFNYLEKDSINSLTQGKVHYMIQDVADSSYTTSNLLNTLTILRLKGLNPRAVIIDYIDLMTSTKKLDKEYDEHGQIIKDLRAIAKEYHIPIITATQLKRETENPKVPLNNTTMGDSYKKVRFSDYILMLRQIYEYDQEEFINLLNLNNYINFSDLEHILNELLPVEYNFTKVKDSDKTPTQIQSNNKNQKSNLAGKNLLIFSKFNLCLYDNPNELYQDYLSNKEKQNILNAFLNIYYNLEHTDENTLSNIINSINNLDLSFIDTLPTTHAISPQQNIATQPVTINNTAVF